MDWTTLDELRDKHESDAGLPFFGPEESYWIMHGQNERKFVLVDVRTDSELLITGTPEGSIHVVWSVNGVENPNFLSELSELVTSKSENMIFMCRSGSRSSCAAKAAMLNGYSNVYNLNGGYNAISVSAPKWLESWVSRG
ncbi:rhodanese-like domain-containing protein [Candidatus Ichthyocystis hellenicum]|uniref:rhodanese-like domain-containing protein n=2 Tax=Candidatus Ichthyocystis TaxID=2929841 RepID=UPI0015859AF7|nr:rhodanese-like domain-containing protein [Candidatus Ichthyocystis hellenicum]